MGIYVFARNVRARRGCLCTRNKMHFFWGAGVSCRVFYFLFCLVFDGKALWQYNGDDRKVVNLLGKGDSLA